ncbi:MAG TPA: hypothetical protein VK508_07385 [Cyclobacteriaceae bacterium]|nr:hypothetical protein [Cyclobacteriaceae bacterium]
MKHLSLIGLAAMAALACACSSTTSSIHEHTTFSKADSLTDAYLVLSDSLLQSWNRIVGNEMDKTRTLEDLISDLDNAQLLSDEARESFQVRIEQLEKIRFTQQTIGDTQIVEDYDLAFQSIVNDIAELAKSPGSSDPNAMFSYLQKNSFVNRMSYDSLARSFNEFLMENKAALKDLDTSTELDAKPVFIKIK